MPRSNIAIKNFTPVPDALIVRYGLMTAAVYGRVWRYCEMRDNVCYASLQSLGNSLGVDRATIMRHLSILVADGYLEDLTPEVRNRPHIYKVTDALVWNVSFGVAESNTTVAESSSGVELCNSGVAESYLKKVLKKEVKKEA